MGNRDTLAGHSRILARKLASLGVPVDSLFYAENQLPLLSHEYQFILQLEPAKDALERSAAFVKGLCGRKDL